MRLIFRRYALITKCKTLFICYTMPWANELMRFAYDTHRAGCMRNLQERRVSRSACTYQISHENIYWHQLETRNPRWINVTAPVHQETDGVDANLQMRADTPYKGDANETIYYGPPQFGVGTAYDGKSTLALTSLQCMQDAC